MAENIDRQTGVKTPEKVVSVLTEKTPEETLASVGEVVAPERD